MNDDIEVDKEDFKAGMMGHYQIDEQDAGDGSVCSYTGQEHPHPEEMKGAAACIVVSPALLSLPATTSSNCHFDTL